MPFLLLYFLTLWSYPHEFTCTSAIAGTSPAFGISNHLVTTFDLNPHAAINALQQRIQSIADTAFIDDTDLEASSTALSASKVSDLLRSLKTELLNGTENALETFQVLQEALMNDQTGMQALLLSLNQRVRFDAQQNLTPAQQQQARQNIGAVSLAQIGDMEADFVAIFEQTLEKAV